VSGGWRLASGLAWALALAFAAPAPASPPVRVEAAWLRAPLPGVGSSAGYMTIVNDTRAPLRLTAVESEAATAISVHETRVEDGISRMVPVPALAVPAGGEVRLRPGGLHLMIDPGERRLQPGDTVPLTLRFAGGLRVHTRAEVRRAAPGDQPHHPH